MVLPAFVPCRSCPVCVQMVLVHYVFVSLYMHLHKQCTLHGDLQRILTCTPWSLTQAAPERLDELQLSLQELRRMGQHSQQDLMDLLAEYRSQALKFDCYQVGGCAAWVNYHRHADNHESLAMLSLAASCMFADFLGTDFLVEPADDHNFRACQRSKTMPLNAVCRDVGFGCAGLSCAQQAHTDRPADSHE